jgi:hypothetical protein
MLGIGTDREAASRLEDWVLKLAVACSSVGVLKRSGDAEPKAFEPVGNYGRF